MVIKQGGRQTTPWRRAELAVMRTESQPRHELASQVNTDLHQQLSWHRSCLPIAPAGAYPGARGRMSYYMRRPPTTKTPTQNAVETMPVGVEGEEWGREMSGSSHPMGCSMCSSGAASSGFFFKRIGLLDHLLSHSLIRRGCWITWWVDQLGVDLVGREEVG